MRHSLTTVTRLLEATDRHAGVPIETRHCLDQVAAEMRDLLRLHERLLHHAEERDASSSFGVRPSALMRDRLHLTDVLPTAVAGTASDRSVEGLSELTAQERRILQLLATGFTNRQIADELFLAEKTVKNYVSNLLRKLGMARRTQAAVFAARLGWQLTMPPVGGSRRAS